MQRQIAELTNELNTRAGQLQEKQTKLFNLKDLAKWGNPDLTRMVLEDQKELFKDTKNMGLILP